jgi:Flp pilus assembly protein TadD
VKADPVIAEALAAFERGELDRARAIVERQLALEPDSPQLQHVLGVIHCRVGDCEAGVEWLGRACDAEPGNIPFRLMLVRALVDAGRTEDALARAVRPCGTGPSDLALWHARAEAAAAASDFVAAAEAWHAICSTPGADWRAWLNLARSLLAMNRFGEAEAAYRTVLAARPGEVAALRELGMIYDRTNQREALCELLDRKLVAGIGEAELPELWAIRAHREGRLDDARALLMKAEAGTEPGRWNRLRSKIADVAGDPAEAFQAATAMNRATPDHDQWRAQAVEYRRELRETAKAITPEWAARLPGLDRSERRSPAFLLGFPRSGTTLLDTLLMGHPGVTVLEEQGLLQAVARDTGPIGELTELSAPEFHSARDCYFALLNRHADAGSTLTIDKAPLNMLFAPLIHCLFEGAPIIFMQRHPCDAVLSGFMQSFEPNLGMASFLDIADAADFYDAAMGLWTASAEVLSLNIHRVWYEELVRDPEAVLRPLLKFLSLDWDERVLDHRATALRRGAILNTSYDQVVEPLTTAAVGRWRRYERQLEPVLPVLLPWAEHLGYSDS